MNKKRCIILLTRPRTNSYDEWGADGWGIAEDKSFAVAVQGEMHYYPDIAGLFGFLAARAAAYEIMVVWIKGNDFTDLAQQRQFVNRELRVILAALGQFSSLLATHGWGAPSRRASYTRGGKIFELGQLRAVKIPDIFDATWNTLEQQTQPIGPRAAPTEIEREPGAVEATRRRCLILLTRPSTTSGPTEWNGAFGFDPLNQCAAAYPGKMEESADVDSLCSHLASVPNETRLVLVWVNGTDYTTIARMKHLYISVLPKILEKVSEFRVMIGVHNWPIPDDKQNCFWASYGRGDKVYQDLKKLGTDLRANNLSSSNAVWAHLEQRGTELGMSELVHRIKGFFGPVDLDLQGIWEAGQPSDGRFGLEEWREACSAHGKTDWSDQFEQVRLAVKSTLQVRCGKEAYGLVADIFSENLRSLESESIELLGLFATGQPQKVYGFMKNRFERLGHPNPLHEWMEALDQHLSILLTS